MPRYSEATLSAIKHAVDIVGLASETLTLHASGSKFKALCPFHDDHNPSLELNPERQSYKCWSCGAGGDVFDFVMAREVVDFPEALRMLAERAGVTLESPSDGPRPLGPSKSDLLTVNSWAEQAFADALARTPEAQSYVSERGLSPESVARFRLGYAPDARDWLTTRARREGFSAELLEKAGLIVRSKESPGFTHERFRGRLIFPIHDIAGRTLGFGGRIMPAAQQALAAQGKNAAKYLNSPETSLFLKRRVLFAADLARAASREAGWVAVVEGYTDVIAAHQVGLQNVVGTLGTALGDDHVQLLRRLADRVVLVFDGDDAGQNAADRSLEFFLGHEVDVRVLSLPSNLDPCDFLLSEGADAFRSLVEQAVDPMTFAIRRASSRFDLDSPEDARRAAEWVLTVLGRVPASRNLGLDVKVAKALDTLSRQLRVPVETLKRRLKQLQLASMNKGGGRAAPKAPAAEDAPKEAPPVVIRPEDLDVTDRELVQIILNQPDVVGRLSSRVAVASIRDAPLRAILQACFDLHAEGTPPTFERVALRLDDPAVRSLAAGLLSPIVSSPLPKELRPAPWEDLLAGVLARIDERDWQVRLRDLQDALKEVEADPEADPASRQALRRELFRHHSMRPDTKKKSAS